jgi:hypothetical protein
LGVTGGVPPTCTCTCTSRCGVWPSWASWAAFRPYAHAQAGVAKLGFMSGGPPIRTCTSRCGQVGRHGRRSAHVHMHKPVWPSWASWAASRPYAHVKAGVANLAIISSRTLAHVAQLLSGQWSVCVSVSACALSQRCVRVRYAAFLFLLLWPLL